MIDTRETENSRLHQRYPLHRSIQYRSLEGTYQAELLNISLGGLCLASTGPLAADRLLRMAVPVPRLRFGLLDSCPTPFAARVVWIDGDHAGVSFVDPRPVRIEILRRFIARYFLLAEAHDVDSLLAETKGAARSDASSCPVPCPGGEMIGFRAGETGLTQAFWDLIEQGRADRAALQARLQSLGEEALRDFCWAFLRAQCAISPDLVGSDLSEDELDTITEWVVAQGKAFYERIAACPERMPGEVDANDSCMGILGDAMLIYKRRFGSWVPPSPDALF
jgi:hypothetical protein